MNDQDHSLSLSDPDRSLVLSHLLTNFLQNLASCHTALTELIGHFGQAGSETIIEESEATVENSSGLELGTQLEVPCPYRQESFFVSTYLKLLIH
jgi:hypothetical protein